MGSGKLIRRVIEKHGKEVLEKKILHVFDTEQEMNAKEAELVTEEFCQREDTYNLCSGGHGGWSYLNREYWSKSENFHKRNSGQVKNHPSRVAAGHRTSKINFANVHIDGLAKYNNFKGKKHTEDTKKKISKCLKGRNTGEQSSQFGSMWITNNQETKKIKKTDVIPEGWRKGRTMAR